MPAAMPCKTPVRQSSGETCRGIGKHETKTCLYCRCRRVHDNSIGRSSLLVSWGSHCSERNRFTQSLQLGAQVYSDVLLNFLSWVLHKVVCRLLALQSGRTITNQENLPCLHDMASLATNSSCRTNVLLRSSTFVEFRCSVHLLATADQLDQFPQDPVLPLQTFRRL